MAQDDYYYEIQLTNKQLVFYFLAGATVLILCFLAGIMVGRGVDVRGGEARVVREEALTPTSDGTRTGRGTPVPADSYSYPQRLVSERPPETLETRVTPANAGTAVASVPRSTPMPPARTATPVPVKATPTPKAVATPKPSATPTPRPSGASSAEGPLTLQVGAFKDKASADSVVTQLRRKGYAAHATSPDGTREGLYVVRVGPYRTRADAERARARLEQDRFKPFIVRQ